MFQQFSRRNLFTTTFFFFFFSRETDLKEIIRISNGEGETQYLVSNFLSL